MCHIVHNIIICLGYLNNQKAGHMLAGCKRASHWHSRVISRSGNSLLRSQIRCMVYGRNNSQNGGRLQRGGRGVRRRVGVLLCLLFDAFVIEHTVSRYPARTYGERIRRKRLELGLRQVDLAKLLSVSEMSVVGWEKVWHRACRRYRKKIGGALGVEYNPLQQQSGIGLQEG